MLDEREMDLDESMKRKNSSGDITEEGGGRSDSLHKLNDL